MPSCSSRGGARTPGSCRGIEAVLSIGARAIFGIFVIGWLKVFRDEHGRPCEQIGDSTWLTRQLSGLLDVAVT
jgi:hypothetical protein